jgi:alkylhydroperoxidase/carboxymuconolactone decarboxylase family protein YurZ
MRPQSDRETWIRIRREDEIPPDAPNTYNFGFRAAMGRLQATHPPIGRAFSALFRQIMFEPGQLSRQEREMMGRLRIAITERNRTQSFCGEDGDAHSLKP